MARRAARPGYDVAMANHRWAPSVTVAAIVDDGGQPPRFLLVEEHTAEGLKLNNPAGHLEPGESPLQAVQREALEETTRVFTPQALLGIYMSRFVRPASGEDVTYLRIAYRGSVGDPLPGLLLDTGIVRTLWMTADALRAQGDRLRSPLVLRCVLDCLAGRAFPLDTVLADASLLDPEVKG
jgi:8-oxo-dGTP pyrophosphatase MutT (NUDIX family)